MRLKNACIVAGFGTRLTEVGGENLLFVPSRQSLFSASATTVSLWPRLKHGMVVSEFIASVDSLGDDGKHRLAELIDAEAVEFLSPRGDPVAIDSQLFIDIAGTSMGLAFAGVRALPKVRPMLSHLETSPRDCSEHLIIVEEDERVGIAYVGEDVDWSPWQELGPMIKMALTDVVLDQLKHPVLHVASLVADDNMLLLTGPPGAGKSTLAVALGAQGYSLKGDDLAVLHPGGRIMPLPFAATVKSGAWPLLEGLVHDIGEQPDFERPDGQTVRYIGLNLPGELRDYPVRCVVCLDREPASKRNLVQLGAVEALGALLEGAWSSDERLSPDGFDALADCVEGADFFRMTYSSLDDAVAVIDEAFGKASMRPARAG